VGSGARRATYVRMPPDPKRPTLGDVSSAREGLIDLGEGIAVHPALEEEAFLASAGGRASPFVHNGPQRSYRLTPVQLSDRVFIPVIYFSDGALTMASLSWADPSHDPGDAPWANWSEERERAIAREDAVWLAKALRRTRVASGIYRFRWGMASSGYEAKSGEASVSFLYTRA
jgi:hypothetical protein